MLDWQGNIRSHAKRKRIILSDIPEDATVSSAMAIGSIESKAIINLLNAYEEPPPKSTFSSIPAQADEEVPEANGKYIKPAVLKDGDIINNKLDCTLLLIGDRKSLIDLESSF